MLYSFTVDPRLDHWLARAKTGDVPAFNRLVDHHQSLAYHIAYNHVGTADDALDACQEAMLSAWRALPRFDGDAAAFRRWLFRIVINACRDRSRQRRRRPQVPIEIAGPDEAGWRALPLPDPGESPE